MTLRGSSTSEQRRKTYPLFVTLYGKLLSWFSLLYGKIVSYSLKLLVHRSVAYELCDKCAHMIDLWQSKFMSNKDIDFWCEELQFVMQLFEDAANKSMTIQSSDLWILILMQRHNWSNSNNVLSDSRITQHK